MVTVVEEEQQQQWRGVGLERRDSKEDDDHMKKICFDRIRKPLDTPSYLQQNYEEVAIRSLKVGIKDTREGLACRRVLNNSAPTPTSLSDSESNSSLNSPAGVLLKNDFVLLKQPLLKQPLLKH
ncbi:hypothetical protein Ddye_014256 [Dipteronia dyeriana]|uniref:Uncharacterized protein n=1 Tax=Dipteronia dyeriana TaxID=168575 RepID=A0AAE0CKC4_9ROSI|nr:hypothetical protein Ddye_014256 [Dipteronia dyeriana]